MKKHLGTVLAQGTQVGWPRSHWQGAFFAAPPNAWRLAVLFHAVEFLPRNLFVTLLWTGTNAECWTPVLMMLPSVRSSAPMKPMNNEQGAAGLVMPSTVSCAPKKAKRKTMLPNGFADIEAD
jgi:hypothetical protein